MNEPNLVLRMRDHPRSRVVYWPFSRVASTKEGSSPLARGLREVRDRLCGRPGIIPARAGFTRPRPGRWCQPPDHPRSRGVYRTDSATLIHQRFPGSSPLARGLPHAAGCQGGDGRIIPARAGFTWARASLFERGRDHPRSRGVYPICSSIFSALAGSSPLARGLRGHTQVEQRGPGIIPARAGFTYSAKESAPTVRDHPRSRGVYSSNFASE